MAKQLVGKAPLTQVRTASRGIAFVRPGQPAPADISDEDRTRLLDEGFLEEVDAAEDVPPAPASDTVEAVLKDVGDDKVKAQAALEVENAKDKPRSTLVAKLEAIAEGSA